MTNNREEQNIQSVKRKSLIITLLNRLAYFIYNLCTTPQGAKTLHVKMEELAQLLNTTRLNVSNVLNNWKEEGFIAMRRKEFVIHDISRLIEKALH